MNETVTSQLAGPTGGPGGSGMYRGANYQAVVAAYFAVLALADDRNAIPREIPALAPPSRIGAEQHWAVDDVAVWFGGSVMAWLQAKASIRAPGLPDVVEQFVWQFRHGRERVPGTELSPDDRLVLVLEDAPDWIKADLRDLLLRLGTLAPGEPTETAFQGETRVREAYERVAPLVRVALTHAGVLSDEAHVRHVLRLARVWPVSADELRRAASLTLDHYVVADRATVTAALAVLERHFALAGEQRVVADVPTLRRLLAASGIALKAPPSVAPDVERIVAATGHALDAEQASTVLHAREGDVRVQRSATAHVLRALAAGNVAVVGEAGAGKSGVLAATAVALNAVGERVVFVDATDPTMMNPRAALGLSHTFADVLTGWVEDRRPAYLLVDGLDRTRVGEIYGAVVRTMRELRTRGAPVRVAVATREYDLQYAPELRDALPFDPAQGVPEEARDRALFGHVAHVYVRALDDDELRQVTASSQSLEALLTSAPQDARRLLRNPFNLSIAAALMRDGDIPDLSAVRDRSDLMRLWWERRIKRGSALAKERVLRTIATRMVEVRRLRVPVDILEGGPADEDLLSEGVVARVGRDGLDLVFAHAVFFDYVVARLLLGRERAIAALLGSDRDGFLFVLASIRMRFVDLWRESRPTFYAELAALFAEGNQRRTLLLVAARIVVENLRAVDDLLPLLDGDAAADLAAVRLVVRNLVHERELGRPLTGDSAQPWGEIALEMARRLPRHEHDTLLLLKELLADGTGTATQATAIAEAARLALEQQLDRDPYNDGLMRLAIGSFVMSYDADAVAAGPLLERLLKTERLAQFSKYELAPIAYALDHLHDPAALERVYDAVFSEIPRPEGQVTIGGGSAIMNLVQDASQTISNARYALGRHFAAFLLESPNAAIRALCGVIEREVSSSHERQSFDVAFEDDSLTLLHDASNVWDSDTYQHEPWHVMAKAFETRLREGIDAGDGFFEVALAEMREHAHAAYLWRVVVRGAGSAAATAERLVPFVAQTTVLMSRELGEPVAGFLATGYTRLAEPTRFVVDAAVLALLEGGLDEDHRRWREGRVREYARAIGRDAIMTDALRVFAAPDDPEELPGYATRRRALALSGSYMSGVSTSRVGLQELVPRDAPQELVDAIDVADDLFQASNQAPTSEQAAAVVDTIRRLDAASRDTIEGTRAVALDIVAALMRIGLQWNTLDEKQRAEFLPLVLEGLQARGKVDTEYASADDDHGDWFSLGSPNAVDDGVQILWRLYRHNQDDRVLAALRELMHYPRAVVRAVAVADAGSLGDVDADLVWEIAERAAKDSSFTVVRSADDAARSVAHLDPPRYDRLRFGIYDRFVPDRLKTDYVRHLISWAVFGTLKGAVEARRRIDPVLAEPWAHVDAAESVVFDLVNRLAPIRDAEMREAAAMVLTKLAERLITHADSLVAQHGYNLDAYPEPQKAEAEAAIRLICEIAERVFYVSGVFHHPNAPSAAPAELETEAFALLRPILTALSSFRFSRSAHFVVQTLLGATRAQPREALQMGLTAIRNGVAGGLVREALSEDDVRAFIVRYIDEHRNLLEADPAALSGIMDVVDEFVDAGWPRWIDVVFKLDTIYRGN